MKTKDVGVAASRNSLRLLLLASGAVSVAGAVACASARDAEQAQPRRDDDGGLALDGASPEAGVTCRDRSFPCSRMVFAEGSPAIMFRVFVPNSNLGGEGPFPAPLLSTHVGSEEMPSFDRSGKSVAYVRIEDGARSIRMVGVDGRGDRLVVACSGACELPYFAIDDSIWFVDRLATGVAQPKHVVNGAATSPPWSQEISGCVLRSMRTTLERDGIVLSLVAGPSGTDAGAEGGAEAGDDAGDAATVQDICPGDGPSIVLARLDATTLSPRKLLVHKGTEGVGPLEVLTQVTASTVTGRIFAIANSLEGSNPAFVTAFADGEIISRSGDAYDAFDLATSTTENLEYFIARQRDDQADPSGGYSQYWLVGQGAEVVGLQWAGVGARTDSRTIGPPALAPYTP